MCAEGPVAGSGLNKERDSSASESSSLVSELSLVPSDKLSALAVGVYFQFLSSSANMVVSSPLIEISLL